MSSRDFFKGKRVAVIGLGPHGEMVADVKFLIKAGALTALYDMRSEVRIKADIMELRDAGLAAHVCGSVPADDLLDMDLIILSYEYPRDSSFLKQAHAANIQIEYPETLFFKLSPLITLVGVMGVCGKSTVISMLRPMLEDSTKAKGHGFHVIDHESPDGILANLKDVKAGDVVLGRLSSPMMEELSAMGVSPHVAVFTTVPAVGTYVRSPFEVLSRQTYNNYVVGSDHVIDAVHAASSPPKSKMLRTKGSLIPDDWRLSGEPVGKSRSERMHDRDNAALAFETAKIFKVSDVAIREALDDWNPPKGRLEPVKSLKQIRFYNDAASTSALATEAAIQSLASAEERSIVLIMGGAEPAGDYRALYGMLPRFAHTVVLVPGSGTMRERSAVAGMSNIEVLSAPSLEDAVAMAFGHSKKGDRVLYSPGFAAGGFDRSRKERAERFVKAVRALK